MREIIVKKNGVLLVKLPYDVHIIDEYNDLKDLADEMEVTISSFGSDSSIPPSSIVIMILTTGKNFKLDNRTGENVLWMKANVIQSTSTHYSVGMEVWIKFSQSVLAGMGYSSVPDIRNGLYRKKLLVNGVAPPYIKQDENVNFVHRFLNASVM